MSVPGIVQSRLDGEQVAAQVPLGSEDGLFVTPTRTLIYRADGLLSDESVEEYPHDAERISISEGRRKSAIELDYGIEGDEKFKVPSNRLYEALHPVLAGVLNAAGVTTAEETVKQTYQFSELTLVITSERVVKHVGAAVWDQDYEEYHFGDVTSLGVEEGSVSSQIIVESGGRPQRIKTPSDQTREVRERIERALVAYHGADSYEAFAREHADAESTDDADSADSDGSTGDAGSGEETADPLAGGVDPIDANPPELDDDGAIVEDDASVTTGEQAGAGSAPDASADANAGTDTTANADANAGTDTTANADANADAGVNASADQNAGAEDAAIVDADGADAARTGSANTGGTNDGSRAGDEPRASDGSESGNGFADSGFESASSELESDDTEAQLEALTTAVERQNELLAEQQRTLEQLVDELSRGR
ncbi:DUF7115 domain-containing protein [Halorussus litoreus]|uniref:DUF7115 domain-containing protein n=1 Tax=Halorussus litoreus TaxID=1710536 RepID=UPI000E28042B|nr:hypothetical protein [Halorussus litoreus]